MPKTSHLSWLTPENMSRCGWLWPMAPYRHLNPNKPSPTQRLPHSIAGIEDSGIGFAGIAPKYSEDIISILAILIDSIR